MMNIPFASKGEKFDMKATLIDKSGIKVPVFEARVEKNVILHDQPKDLLAKENAHQSVEQVKGNAITIGSLTEVSTTGNWPPIYDRRKDN